MHAAMALPDDFRTVRGSRTHNLEPIAADPTLRFPFPSNQTVHFPLVPKRKSLDIDIQHCYLSDQSNIGAPMPKATSGRIVVDVDPALKRRLYSVLAMEDSTLKDWFIRSAEIFIDEKYKPSPRTNREGPEE